MVLLLAILFEKKYFGISIAILFISIVNNLGSIYYDVNNYITRPSVSLLSN